MNLMRMAMILGCAFLLIALSNAKAADPAPCQIHMFLFIPADVTPSVGGGPSGGGTGGYQPRMDQIVNYTDAFFQRELKRWGHRDITSPFRRSADGHVEVTVLRGKQKIAQYKPVTVRAEVMDHLRAQNRITAHRQIWWIMVYAGEPPARFDNFLGGVGREIGGWSVCNFDTAPGRISPTMPLGSDFAKKLMLKGMIHELGHAFGLPHIGPLKRDNLGNTLMGPTHHNYERVLPGGKDEQRVYLSEAEAAILAMHPAFRGTADERLPAPTIKTHDLKYIVSRRTSSPTITITGRVSSQPRARYALVADESDARPGQYWTKTYVARVAPDGSFRVTVSEPSESDGTLRTWFTLESGIQTADPTTPDRSGSILQPYTYTRNQWTFN